MHSVAALGAAATVISTAFALCTLDRWLARHKLHELAWSLSLAMFAIASGAYWWSAATGWSASSFRVFYLFGAILNVPYLAVGTVALLRGESVGRRVLSGLHVVAAFCAGAVLIAPLHRSVAPDGLPSGKEVFGVGPRIMAAVGSGVGATVVIVGAVASVYRLLRSRRTVVTAGRSKPGAGVSPGRLAATNSMIALGTLLLGVGGAGFTGAGAMVAFGVFLTVGVALLFVGFLLSSPSTVPAPRRPRHLSPFLEELWDLAHHEPSG